MGAAYLFHLDQNHPFVDGNKRVGAASARTFMRMNDATFGPPNAEYEALVLAVARGEMRKDDVIIFFRRHARF